MRKKLFTLLLAVAAGVGTMFAEKVQISDLYYNLDATNQTAEVTSQNSSYPYWSTSITTANIPSSVEYNSVAYSVTSIGGSAFYGCSGLTSVTIPNSVTSIGDGAFYNCTGLTSVTINSNVIVSKTYSSSSNFRSFFGPQVMEYIIGEDVTSIGDYAFAYCTGLNAVDIPNSVTSIGGSAFYGCTGLTSMTIPNSVTSIGGSAFYGCTGLTSMTIPNSVTSIGDYAFYGCTGLTSMTIPNSVTSIGDYAFDGCSALTSVTIPNSVTSIGYRAFYGCTGLTSVTIPNSVTSIGNYAFAGCSGLTGELVIPNSVGGIGDYAFSGCSSLTSVTIGNKVTSIGDSAFSGCSGITSIKWNAKNCNGGIFGIQVESFTFGDSVEVIPANLCQGMNRLTTITIPNCVKNIENSAFEGCSGIISVTLNSNAIVSKEYPYSSLKNIFGEQVKTYVIGDSVTSIGREAFFACTSLTSVTIGNNVTTIGYRAFARCSGLTSIEIPNSVTSIGEGTFANCSGLTSITIPESVTSIGDYAFLLCTGLTSVYISDLAAWCEISFEYSGRWDQSSNPFYYAHNLYLNDEIITDLVIPDSVLSIKNYAFYGCSDLTSVTIPKSVRSIGEYAFQNCTGLTSVYISDLAAWCEISFEHNVYSMDKATSNPLYYAHNLYLNGEILTNLVIPNSVFSIKNYAFSGCSALTSVTIPNCVTNIGRETFCDCSSLRSVTIPNSVVNIGNYAFSGCSALTSVTIPNNVTNIGDYVFKGCIGLTSVTIPKSVTRIGSNAFNGCCSITSVTWNAKNCNAYNFGSHVESFILGDSVEVIPANLCDGMNKLRTMAIPNSVASIGSNAFNGCSSITSVTWNAKNCNAYNFGTQVTLFTFGENVEVIPASLCSGMSLLTEIIIPNSVTSIGNNAFNGCNGITSVIWNAKNCNAYNFGTQVTSFTFGENVEVIPANLCDGMNKLQSLPFGKNIKRIGNNAFRGCENVGTLSLPSSLKFIGDEAFSGWKKITKLNIPNDVDSIGSRAFENCIYVTSIYLGNKITEIGDYAFNGCTRVNDITCMNTVTPTVYANTLSSINSLAYLYVRAGSKRTYQLDPYWGRFDIQELTTDESTLTKDEVIIEAHDDNAVFTWPMNTAAATYSLQITKAGEVFCTLTFNSNGQLTGIAFAPSRNGAPHTPAATTSISGMSFTVTGLDVATRYEYNLTIKDNQQQVIKDYSGRFATQGYVPEKYTITFVNWDGAELLTLTEVEEGTIPAYTGATPTRQETAEFAYTFAGWAPEIAAATSDATYTATYTATRKSYTITWLQDDGSLIDQTSVEYGKTPIHANPTKAATAEYTYTFAGWTPTVVAVTGDATYKATFNATKNKYLIVFQDEDGAELKSEEVEYGEMPIAPAPPSKPADSEYTYTFAGWTPEIVVVTKEAVYTATYDATPVSEGLEDVSSDDIAPRKLLIDNIILILRGDKTYTLQGQELR